ncbi:hypothetical protein TRIP_B200576 [uncultured Desulfatiglans sp.]|uniref:Chemotaxis phosphatase CheX-like domain-containing protein n=1 Tax=Uncultured Desulfatiglans sp. TaxID=1748965 RepID=A0A653A325_UNCDX|nr:hypothetical protein TRIP_B200576 [uncultured Desulfatiglans sp.]
MSDKLKEFDLTEQIARAAKDVFSTMLTLDVNLEEAQEALEVDGDRIMGSVGFAGDVAGIVCIIVSSTFAKFLTSRMLDCELEAVEAVDDVNDVIGELCNMIGGNLKSRFCDFGLPCTLTIPSITRGTRFRMTPVRGSQRLRMHFRCEDIPWEFHLYLKAEC